MTALSRVWTFTGPAEGAAELLRSLSVDGFAVQTVGTEDPMPDEVVIRAFCHEDEHADIGSVADDLGFDVEETTTSDPVIRLRDVVIIGSDERLVTTWVSDDETEQEAIERVARFFGLPPDAIRFRAPLDLGTQR